VNAELITAIAGLLTAITTLVKVLQHDGILKDTQQSVNGQAKALDSLTARGEVSQGRLQASIKVMEQANSDRSATSA
jgi:hypothetical protein